MKTKCVIDGSDACVTYPLLPGSPSFCHSHYNSTDAGLFGVDFGGPDDFDIPWEPEQAAILVFKPPFNTRTGVWTDKSGKKCKLTALTDSHLLNIRRWVTRRAALPIWETTSGVEDTLVAVDAEITKRGL